MIRSKLIRASCIFSVVILMRVIPIGISLAQDIPGDEPPPNDLSLDSLKSSSVGIAASSSSNIKTFRTDTGPELDFYQPCNGGDNEINFNIAVQDVDISSVESARLTLAVWDVDFDCGSACGGVCERDPVYINGTELTTPVSYLTGANNQWSSVTFDVDPGLLVNGNNYIQVLIDILSNSCWCVTVDWAELTLVLAETTPEIEDITITPAIPETTENVTFTATLKNMTGYEVVKIAWAGDIQAGEGDPSYTTKPDGGTHGGNKNVTATLTYKNTATNQTGTHSKSKSFDLFFKKGNPGAWGDDDGEGDPNWFEYWNSDGAVASLNATDVIYDQTLGNNTYGFWSPGDDNIHLGGAAAMVHYPTAISVPAGTNCPGGNFGGARGINSVAEVLSHERRHETIAHNWNTGGIWDGSTDSDNHWGLCWPQIVCHYNDSLPDDYETNTLGTDSNNVDSCDLAQYKSSVYKTYGDNEFDAMNTSDGETGNADNDWANPGAQTTPSYISAVQASQNSPLYAAATNIINGGVQPSIKSGPTGLVSPVGAPPVASWLGNLTGSYSDTGIDLDGNSLFNKLKLSIGVQINEKSLYNVVAWLENSAGQSIAWASRQEELDAGSHTIDLLFDGPVIRKSKLDGPYKVVKVELRAGDEEAVVTAVNNPHTTAAYKYTDFDSSGSEIVGNISENTRDTNGNGLADYLDITVTVTVVKAGDITLEGFLRGPDDKSISYVKTTKNLAAGNSTLTLSFDGKAIRQNRKNGPYKLRSLALFEGSNRTDFIYDPYETKPYIYTEFEGGDAELTAPVTFRDYGVDLDIDGLFDLLRIEMNVDVAQAGRYLLFGRLFDKDGNTIVDAETRTTAGQGSQKFILDFSGLAIGNSGDNGPYKVKYAFLYNEMGSLMDQLKEAYSTSAYNYKQFERSFVSLTGNYSDTAIDSNNDGRYEYLAVNVGVLSVNTGNYALNARLMDKYGNEIVWASTTAWLIANQSQSMQLKFDGQSIYNHGINGPYYLRDVYVYNMANNTQSDYVYDAYVTTGHWPVGNEPPIANAGPDQTVERTSAAGAAVTLDGSGSSDPDGDALTYNWTWSGGSASGVNPTVTLPQGLTTVTLTVSDSEFSSTDTVNIIIVDTTPPTVKIIIPDINDAVQDGVTLTAEASDISGVASVYFYVREPGNSIGTPIGYENLAGTYNSSTGKWEYNFDTTLLQDGYYIILAKAVDTYGNEGWSAVVPFSIRNWAVITLLPASVNNKAGRTMPIKFALRISASVDPSMPFVYNEDLTIKIYKASNPGNILQTSLYGSSSTDYRIDSVGEKYITNFKTLSTPATYVVEIWRMNKNWKVGSFTFKTVK